VVYDPESLEPSLIERYIAPLKERRKRRAVMEAGARIWPPDLEAIVCRIPTIEAPSLIIWGREDRITPPHLAYRYERELARGRLVMLPECGHVPQEEKPEAVERKVLQFLDELA
jgi:pimeloyl-ACP methyl ester carboxylesterase